MRAKLFSQSFDTLVVNFAHLGKQKILIFGLTNPSQVTSVNPLWFQFGNDSIFVLLSSYLSFCTITACWQLSIWAVKDKDGYQHLDSRKIRWFVPYLSTHTVLVLNLRHSFKGVGWGVGAGSLISIYLASISPKYISHFLTPISHLPTSLSYSSISSPILPRYISHLPLF